MQNSLTPYLTAGAGTLSRLSVANTVVAMARPDRLELARPGDAFEATASVAARRKDVDDAIAEIDDLLIL